MQGRTPTASIHTVTPILRLARLFRQDREQALKGAGIDASTLDLLSVLRRAGSPYELSTREITQRTLVSAGAISQRIARAENADLVLRRPGSRGKTVIVTLTDRGHTVIEASVDQVLTSEFRLLDGLSPAERSTLEELLEKLLGQVARRMEQPSVLTGRSSGG